jgi:glutamate-5-semialdehyde dehydrogenase
MNAPASVTSDLNTLCRTLADRARAASKGLAIARGEAKDRWLESSADAVLAHSSEILDANRLDVEAAPGYGLSPAAIDRLTLTDKRLHDLASALRTVRALPDPIGEVVRSSKRPNGLDVQQIRVPLGVVFFIYESRPNVTADAAALCVKSGNAVILRGGKEALHSNQALHRVLSGCLAPCGLPADSVQLVPTPDRSAVGLLLGMSDRIDLAIPRGGEGLIRRVAAEATMPVMKHYQGICHVYVDKHADESMAVSLIENAKVQRPGVCNAAETLLVHQDIAPSFLPRAASVLNHAGVELRGDDASRSLVPSMTPAPPQDWDTE